MSTETLKDVHTEHCCLMHGCHYGPENKCTVMTGQAPQSHLCEDCERDGIESLEEAALFGPLQYHPVLERLLKTRKEAKRTLLDSKRTQYNPELYEKVRACLDGVITDVVAAMKSRTKLPAST